ncbi:MAG TPA: sodium/solute symporter [Nitrososphaera sp.]|nr:sodium/solute symporter [Nitrososphaera sp.]
MVQVLPESYGYFIVLGIGALMALVVTFLIKAETKWLGTRQSLEWFSTAGRNVKTGLIASSVVSAWTWAATLLQSSTVAYEYGIGGPFWYAAGASIQIILFGILAVGLKRRAPNVHTFPEIIKNRFGKGAHKVFLTFAILTNTVVISMLVLGGVAVINSLTGINIYLAAFMIPIGIIAYTFVGGLKATFLADYANAAFLFIVVLIFVSLVYFSTPEIGGISGMYDKLTAAAQLKPVEGNALGSYLTLASMGALAFGVINIVGNFGTVFVDQSYWLRAIAAKPSAAAKGYMMGGLAWFAIPFALATTLGLAAVAMNIQLSNEETSLGLVAPSAAYALFGDLGAILLLAILFTAVTSAGSAQLTAVSTLGVYDIYRTYLRPKSSDESLLKKSRLLIVGFGLGMGLLATILLQIGVSLQYVYLVMGILIGSAVAPIALTLLWNKTDKNATVFGAIGGLAAGLAVWLGSAVFLYGELSIQSTGRDIPLLLGNITSISTGAGVCIIGSLLRSVRGSLEKSEVQEKSSDESDSEFLLRASQFAKRYALIFSVILVIAWPLPLSFSGYVFSEVDFHIWIIIATAWTLVAATSTICLPILESRAGITKVLQNAAIPLVLAGVITVAVIVSSYLYDLENQLRTTLLPLIQDEIESGTASPDIITAVEQQGSYSLKFIFVVLGIVGVFSAVVVALNSKLRKMVRVQTLELEKANDDLVTKGKLKDEFLKIASHELRTPIQPILGYSELALKGLVPSTKALTEIYREAKRLRQLTNDILDVSKIETNNIEYRMEKIDIVELLTSAVENLKLQTPVDVKLNTRFDPRVSHITADKERLAQVFTNILGNAVKFTSVGQIDVETFYVSSTASLRIEFRDTGPGIPAAVFPRLFEKFATVDVEGRNRNGTGLGLYLCRRIVERHDGTIDAQNNRTGGAIFAVIIPINLKTSERHTAAQA